MGGSAMLQDCAVPPSLDARPGAAAELRTPQLPQGLSDPHLRAHGLTLCLHPSSDWMKQESESVWNKTSPPRAHLKWARGSSPATICRRNVVRATACDRQPDCLVATAGAGLSLLVNATLHYSASGPHWAHTAFFTSLMGTNPPNSPTCWKFPTSIFLMRKQRYRGGGRSQDLNQGARPQSLCFELAHPVLPCPWSPSTAAWP